MKNLRIRPNLLTGITKVLAVFLSFCWLGTASAGETITYYHHDILGTPLATTDESGDVTWYANYYPYGSKQDGNSADTDPQRFTGKEFDDELGLYYFGARYYNPTIARFISVDPEGGLSGNPQTWNRYAYTLNNPYKYVDPDGQWAESAVGFAWSPNSLRGANGEQSPARLNSVFKTIYTIQKTYKVVAGLANNPLVQQSVNALETVVSENSKVSPAVSTMDKILSVVGTAEKLSNGKATWSDAIQLGLGFVELGPLKFPYTIGSNLFSQGEKMQEDLKLRNNSMKTLLESQHKINQPIPEDKKKKSSD